MAADTVIPLSAQFDYHNIESVINVFHFSRSPIFQKFSVSTPFSSLLIYRPDHLSSIFLGKPKSNGTKFIAIEPIRTLESSFRSKSWHFANKCPHTSNNFIGFQPVQQLESIKSHAIISNQLNNSSNQWRRGFWITWRWNEWYWAYP